MDSSQRSDPAAARDPAGADRGQPATGGSSGAGLPGPTERLEIALRLLGAAVYAHNVPLDEATYHSPQWAAMLGYTPEELPRFDRFLEWLYEQVHPDDRARLQSQYQAFVDGSTDRYRVEVRLRHKDGEWRWMRGVSEAVRRDARGRVRSLVGAMLDISSQKAAEEAGRESESRLRSVLDSSHDVAYRRDLRTDRYDYLSPAVMSVLGIPSEQLRALSVEAVLDRIHPDDRERVAESMAEGMHTREGRAEYRFRGDDGRYRWVADHFTVQVAGDGTPISRTGIVRDITEQKESEEALRRAKEAAEEASRVKSQFLSTMSHELRTPLTAVIGLSDILHSEILGPVNDSQKENLDRIQRSAWHLVRIIEEILTFSRSEAGKERVATSEVDLARLAGEVVSMLETPAAARGLEVRLRGADEAIPVITDPGKVTQILTNLVGNAIKFSDAGVVEVELVTAAEEVEVRVRDSGPGIPAERMDEIFEPFVQLDPSSTRREGGTGLGLTISRRQARLLGGDVFADSTPGVGSTFRLRLPHDPRV